MSQITVDIVFALYVAKAGLGYMSS